MNTKVFFLSCLLAVANAAPSADADAEADPFYYAGHHGLVGHAAPLVAEAPAVVAHAAPYHAAAYHTGPAPNCETVNEVLTTQNCVPSAENICNTVTVDTEEIEYVPLCKEFTDVLCDAPVHAPVAEGYHAIHKREADAEAEADADADAFYGYAHHGFAGHHAAAPLVAHAAPVAVAHHVQAPVAHLPVAHAVGAKLTATVKHACREVVTERCVDNPQVKVVPVDVEHCHVITKVTCTPVENLIPVTTCTAVETTHVSHAAYAAPVAHHVAPIAHHAAYAHHY